MNKLMKRLKRLNFQSGKINQPMFSGYSIDPILQSKEEMDIKEDGAESTDASLLEALLS